MPTTPNGTRTWRISSPLASVPPRTTSPTGSGSAATSRSPWAMAPSRSLVSRRRSIRLAGVPDASARTTSSALATRIAAYVRLQGVGHRLQGDILVLPGSPGRVRGWPGGPARPPRRRVPPGRRAASIVHTRQVRTRHAAHPSVTKAGPPPRLVCGGGPASALAVSPCGCRSPRWRRAARRGGRRRRRSRRARRSGPLRRLLTAMIVLEVCMPARCWMAPEMPAAT